MGSSCEKNSNQDMVSQEEISAFVTSVDVTEKALINEKIPVSISYVVNGSTCHEFRKIEKKIVDRSITYSVILNSIKEASCSDDSPILIIKDTVTFTQIGTYTLLFNESKLSKQITIQN